MKRGAPVVATEVCLLCPLFIAFYSVKLIYYDITPDEQKTYIGHRVIATSSSNAQCLHRRVLFHRLKDLFQCGNGYVLNKKSG